MEWCKQGAAGFPIVRNLEHLKLQVDNLPKKADDDVAFWSFVKPDQKPKTVAEAYINQDEDSEDEISDEEEEKEDMDVE